MRILLSTIICTTLVTVGTPAASMSPRPVANHLPIILQVPPSPPEGLFFVINNTALTLTCTWRSAQGPWAAWFQLAPGAEWDSIGDGSDEKQFYCRPPVRQVFFRLESGERYSLLREGPGAEVRLRRITTRRN